MICARTNSFQNLASAATATAGDFHDLPQEISPKTASTNCNLDDMPQEISPKTVSTDCDIDDLLQEFSPMIAPPDYDLDISYSIFDVLDGVPNGEFYKDNVFKEAEELEAYEGFHVSDWDIGPVGDILGGAIRQVADDRLDAKHLLDAACLALDSYNVKEGSCLEVAKIVKANCGFGGVLTHYITFEASDGMFYEAKVTCCSGIDHVVHIMRPARHYPVEEDSP